ncbi:MAG: hypothetical protein ABW196_07540 [Solirubrobacterales bacterium]
MGRLLFISATALAVLGLLPAAAAAAFGFAEADLTLSGQDGSPAMQAGAHPFALTTSLRLNTVEQSGLEAPDENLEELWVEYPAGLVVTPASVPACAMVDFEEIEGSANECSDSTAIGIAEVTASATGPIPAGTEDFLEPAPVYKLPPDGGVARIGLVVAGQPITAELGLTEAEPYRGYLSVSEIPESVLLYSARVTIWGTPADPSHDGDRGACAFVVASCPVATPSAPLLTAPRSCTGPLETVFEARSRQEPEQWIGGTGLSAGLTGCSKLAFAPQFDAQPTTDLAETPSGFEVAFDFSDDGLANPDSLAQSETQEILLTLPEGMTVDPAAPGGFGCTPAQYAAEDLDPEPGEGCPLTAEVGTVEAESPLLDGTVLDGKVFLAQPDDPTTDDPGTENPFDSPFALYVVLRHPGFGIVIKQAGEVGFDPTTEQLLVRFDQLPQIPIAHLGLSLEGDEGGLLVTPTECGEFTTTATLTPWSDHNNSFLASRSFEIVAGPEDGPCPSGEVPPDDPGVEGPGNDTPASSGSGSAATPPPPGLAPPPGVKPRSCPKGKRRAMGRKGRCVRKRCPRPGARSSARPRRRCLHPLVPR